MKKRKIFILIFFIIAGLGVGIFQYVKTFRAEIVAAYQASKPAAGHSWTEMQCTSDLCIDTTNHRVGIGTDSPSKPLEVTGDALFSGDVCNGSGKCLDSIYETNVTQGTNPTCPAGQTIIMKADGAGKWYTSAALTTWYQVVCGTLMSSDGTALLVNSNHTTKQCTDAGGTVIDDGSGNNMCRFNVGTCPSLWSQYGNWSTTAQTSCMGGWHPSCTSPTGCNTPSHSWANEGPGTCGYSGSDYVACGYSYVCCALTCTASNTQIGCY